MKQRKKILILVIMFINILGLGMVSISEDDEIKKTIGDYFKYKYESLENLKMKSELNKIVVRDNKKLDALDLIEIDINWRSNAELDYRFDKYTYNIDYTSVNYRSNYATVKLNESHTIQYKCMKNSESTLQNLKHKISMKKENGIWHVVSDSYNSEVIDEFDNYRSDDKNEFKNLYNKESKKKINNIDIKSVDENKYVKENNDDIKNNSRGEYVEKEYNRENAAAYALKYALNMNDNYVNYESQGGDCTNFVSQCLYEGGIPKDTKGIYKWYWYADYNRWPSWTSAKEFRKYLVNNKGSKSNIGINAKEATFEEMELGDVVQYTEPTHSMIITGYMYEKNKRNDLPKEKLDVLISQHSVAGQGRLKNYPLGLKPTIKGRYYIKIENYYN